MPTASTPSSRRKVRVSSVCILSIVVVVLMVVQVVIIPLALLQQQSSSVTTMTTDRRVQPSARHERNSQRVDILSQVTPEEDTRTSPSHHLRNSNNGYQNHREQRAISPPSSVNNLTNKLVGANGKQRQPDGTFNDYNIYLRNSTIKRSSSVQCVGENFMENAWIHRSCQFQHFCFDTVARDYVIYQSKADQQLQEALDQHNAITRITARRKATWFRRIQEWWWWLLKGDADENSSHQKQNVSNQQVAIGGINPKWTGTADGVPRLKWSPRVVQGDLQEDYYELDDHVVLVPFHSFAAFNPGHLLWDDFLPIYTLLRIFALLDGYQPLLMRYVLKDDDGRRQPLWATCEMNDEKRKECRHMFAKFLPLFGLENNRFTTTQDFRFALADGSATPKSRLVCAKQGAAGLGMLTDHGFKLHGWSKKDYESMHNHGRGSIFFDFRNFMVSNLGLDVAQKLQQGPTYIITFAAGTSQSSRRAFSFGAQMIALKEAFGDQVVVRKVYIPQESLEDQIRIASESAIYVSACGGGAVTATFLSRGASLILYYSEYVEDDIPARLDWDLFNNMAWVRTHWLPANTMDKDIDLFVKLVARELDLIQNLQLS